MKILVTGGFGFIGSNFCRYEIKKHSDTEITNLDKIGIGSNPSNLKDTEKQEQYKFMEGDIRNFKLLAPLAKKTDAIVNFAAETHVDRSIANPDEFLQNNTVGTFTLLEAMRKHNSKTRFVQVSTDEVYGEIDEGSFTENDSLKPGNPYSASKAAADMFIQAYHRTFGLNVSITRCTNNYGPYQFPEKLIPKTIIRAINNLKIPVYGAGTNIRDWIYVQDHCEAIDLVLRKGQAGQIYNVAADNEIANIQIVKKILKQLDKEEDLINFVEDRPGHDTRYSLDASRIRSDLGWKTRHSFEKALKDTVDWYVQNESWWRPLATKDILRETPWKKK